MGGILFASDLDNTLLFSYRHRREKDLCVERLEGREQGYCTSKASKLLALVSARSWFVPVTTRSVEQYRRIRWPEGCGPRYAAAANGGILLVDGEADEEWLAQTRKLAAPWQGELARLEGRLPEFPMEKRFRMVDGLYLFAACDDVGSAQELGRLLAGETALDTAVSGRKVYFFPPPLNKGEAVRRLQERFQPERTICAGDSVIDLPMLRRADVAIFPEAGMLEESGPVLRACPDGVRFPDFVLGTVLAEIQPKNP